MDLRYYIGHHNLCETPSASDIACKSSIQLKEMKKHNEHRLMNSRLLLSCAFIIFHFIDIAGVKAQTQLTPVPSPRIPCSLDTVIGFIISIVYGASSLLALIVLSYSSFKQTSVFSMKTFGKDLWSKKKCFFPFVANIFDQSSDIGVIISLYLLQQDELEYDHDCAGINASYLFYLSIMFFLLYRIVSGISVYFGTKNIYFSLGQFLCEFMIYRAIWVNYVLQCDEPCSPQRWLQNMEAMLEAFPQLIIQMFFLIQTTDVDSNTIGAQLFILFSIIISLLSLTNKAVSEDKPLFNSPQWQQAKWKCKPPFIKKNPQYLIRVLFRIFDVSSRVIIIVLVWSVLGGTILAIIGVTEFIFLIAITIYEKDQTPSTWIAILPINFYANMKYIHYIIASIRFLQHLVCLGCIFIDIHGDNTSEIYDNVNTITVLFLYYSLISFFCNFLLCVYIVLFKKVTTRIPVSTNRTITELIKLQLYKEVNQMIVFGYVYNHRGFENNQLTYYKTDPGLIFALKNGFIDVAKQLIEENLDVNVKDAHGDPAITLAARLGHYDIVIQLIKHNANVNVKNHNGSTALIITSKDGKIDAAQHLIAANANLNERDNDGYTALIWASRNGHGDIVSQLIDAGADLNETQYRGGTALILAAKNGHDNIVTQLIAANADLYMQDVNGCTALMWAYRRDNLGIVEKLLNASKRSIGTAWQSTEQV